MVRVGMDEDGPTIGNPAERTRTSSRTSARRHHPTVELITRGEPRRRWSIEQKQTSAAESLAPGASPRVVARRYGISSGLLYNWRMALLTTQPGFAAGFARVEITEQSRLGAPVRAFPPKFFRASDLEAFEFGSYGRSGGGDLTTAPSVGTNSCRSCICFSTACLLKIGRAHV